MNIRKTIEPAAARAPDGHPVFDRAAAMVISRIQQNFCERGLSHLSVEFVSVEGVDMILADVVDPNGVVVLSLSVDRATGVLRDIR